MAAGQNPIIDDVQHKLSEILSGDTDTFRCASALTMGTIAHRDAGKALQAALLDEDEDVRTDVMTALAKLADPASADAIMESFLGDPCPEVKLAAIEALVKLRHPEIIPHLVKLIVARDEDIIWDDDAFYEGGWDDWLDIQFAAISSAGELGIADAVQPILTALDDEMGQDVSAVAIPALARLGKAGMQALSDLIAQGDARMRRRICAEITPGLSPEGDEIIEQCLQDVDGEVRETAVKALINKNAEDKRLVDFFEDSNAGIRKLVIENTGRFHPESIMSRLDDNAPSVRSAAFRVIVKFPDQFEKDGFSEIVVNAISGNPNVAGDAAVAWAALIGEPASESLGKALENTDQPKVFRLGLVEALSKLGDAGYAHLAKAAGDAERQVRINALTALGQLAGQQSWPNIAGDTLLAALNGELVLPPDEEETSPLSDAEAEEDAAEPSVEAVSSNGADEGVIEGAIPDSVDPEGLETAIATSTLDQLVTHGLRTEAAGDDDEPGEIVHLDEEDEHFIELSKQRRMRKRKISLDVEVAPHQDVRRFSARLFSDLDRPGVVEALSEALKVKDEELTLSVLDSLACLGEHAGVLDQCVLEPILEVLDGGDEKVRVLAIRCLGWVAGNSADEELLDLIDDDDMHVRQEVVRALGIRQTHREVLVARLKDDYSGVRLSAAKALSDNPDENLAKQLVALSLGYDGMHRSDVVALLKSHNLAEAGALYLKVLNDDASKRAWRVAIEALGMLLATTSDGDLSLAA